MEPRLWLRYGQFDSADAFPYCLVITKPPYEVTETGWGEFEVVIKIHFQDPNERPVGAPPHSSTCM